MSEAKAFAAGYKAAIDFLQNATLVQSCGCSVLLEAATVPLIAIKFEMWQLTQDPDFQESVAQMQRGEGREIDPTEFDNVTGM